MKPMPSDMGRRNKRILAERQRWPEGALKACVDLEDRYPGWRVMWMPENPFTGFEHPAGFWAQNDTVPHHAVEAFRTDLREIEQLLAEGIPPHADGLRWCDWCLAHPSGIASRPVKL